LDAFPAIASFGATLADLIKAHDALEKRFDVAPHAGDIIWSIYQEIGTRRQDARTLSQLHFSQADFLRKEGRNNRTILEAAHRQFLLANREAFEECRISVTGIPDDRRCDACSKLDGQLFSFPEALEQLPVPRLCVSEEGCRCSYMAEPDPRWFGSQ
jgi:hypothetical protein